MSEREEIAAAVGVLVAKRCLGIDAVGRYYREEWLEQVGLELRPIEWTTDRIPVKWTTTELNSEALAFFRATLLAVWVDAGAPVHWAQQEVERALAEDVIGARYPWGEYSWANA